MVKREPHLRSLPAPLSHDRPKYAESEGKVRGEGDFPARYLALFRHFQYNKEKKRFMGRGISPRPIDPQRREFVQPILLVFGHRLGGA
jgi:hypothetical protein